MLSERRRSNFRSYLPFPVWRSIAVTSTLILLLLTGCARQPALKPLGAPEPAPAQTYAWECERNFAFVSRREGNAMWLFLPDHAVQLPGTGDAPDEDYRSANIHFQHHNGQASLELARKDSLARQLIHLIASRYQQKKQHEKNTA